MRKRLTVLITLCALMAFALPQSAFLTQWKVASGGAFSPTDISGLITWMDFADTDTLYTTYTGSTTPAVGDPIAAIDNKAVSGQRIENFGTSGNWCIRRDRINSLPSASFEQGIPYGYTLTNDCSSSCTVIYVVEHAANNFFTIWSESANFNYVLAAENGSSSAITFSSLGTPDYYKNGTITSWTTRDNVYDGMTNQVSIITISDVDLGSASGDTLRIGGYYTGTRTAQDSYFGEILIYDKVLTSAEREQVETYLADKWGL